MEQKVQLFEKQEKIYPKRVWGKFRKLKWWVMISMMVSYYLLPWIRWERPGDAPDQAILIDLPTRRAYFFDVEVWTNELFYLVIVLFISAVLLFFVTSLFGRVWCGYACPQTIWTDLYIWVERIVQGDRNARMKLDKQPWGLKKLYKKALTHVIWLFIALCTGGAWVLYYNDAPTVIMELLTFDASVAVTGWVLGLTAGTYIMAGFAREQVCTYMCPYGRFQSAMFDKDTLIIAYDEDRGETRGKFNKKTDSWDGRGHCIDCTKCVTVCPQGIDIRDGLQLECIACGLCIDACDEVMENIGLPKGLIRYDTEHNKECRREGKPEKRRMFRPRTFFYITILAAAMAGLTYDITNRNMMGLSVLHDRNPLFVTLSDGTVRNKFTLKILNKAHVEALCHIEIDGVEGAKLVDRFNKPLGNLTLAPDGVEDLTVFVVAPKPRESRVPIRFTLYPQNGEEPYVIENAFISGQ